MYFKKYMGRVVLWISAELSYKLGPSLQGPSFMWAELAWAELVLGRVVRNSSCACQFVNYTLATEENVGNLRVCACCNHFPIT